MPRSADPEVRARLVAAAARLLADEGRQALSTRRLAAEVGTSTMAVYTHFGSMDRLQHEVRREGFARLCGELDTAARTDDPVADLAALARAYYEAGVRDLRLYRAMFADHPPTPDDEGAGVFERVLAALRRCVDAGRFHPAEPALARVWAAQVWLAIHGTLAFAHSEVLPDGANRFLLADLIERLAIGYGDDRAAAAASVSQTMRSEPSR